MVVYAGKVLQEKEVNSKQLTDGRCEFELKEAVIKAISKIFRTIQGSKIRH